MLPPMSALPAATLIAVVLAVIGLELLTLLVLARLGLRRALMRQMIPGAAAGLFLTLALLDLSRGGRWLPLWLASAGVAHALDWWQRARQEQD